MSRYLEFCDSLRVGQAKAQEEQLVREDKECTLPHTVAEIVRRLCASFQCPMECVHFIDARSGIATGMPGSGTPLLPFNPEKGRYDLDFAINVAGQSEDDLHPIWIHLECVPLQHGGLEFHLGTEIFRWPDEEKALFNQLADSINRALRESYISGSIKIGY